MILKTIIFRRKYFEVDASAIMVFNVKKFIAKHIDSTYVYAQRKWK